MDPVNEVQINEAAAKFYVRKTTDYGGDDSVHSSHDNLNDAVAAAKKVHHNPSNGEDVHVVQTAGPGTSSMKGHEKITAFHELTSSGKVKKHRPGDETDFHPKHGLSFGGHPANEEAVYEDNEQLDELSSKTLKSYAKKADTDSNRQWNKAGRLYDKHAEKVGPHDKGTEPHFKHLEAGDKAMRKYEKREKGIERASDILAMRGKDHYRRLGDPSLREESLAAATLKPGSRTVADPKSKIEAITSVIGAMHSMRKDDLTKWYTQAMALIGHEADKLPAGASSDSNQSSVDMKTGNGPKTKDAMPKLDHKNNPLAAISVKEDVEEMFVGEDLSEEFKDKASTLFEAAVNARAMVEVARIEEEYETRLEEEVTSILESVEKNLDTYLDYVVEKWMEENQVAIESSLRNEIMEEFIDGLKGLFAEHYINMPEDKVDVVESLAAKVEELEVALDESINENAELKSVIAEAERVSIVAALAEDLTMTQSEKFLALSEGVSFEGDLDAYRAKLEVVKETYFKIKSAPKSTNIEEETFEGEDSTSTVSVDPAVNRYVQAISRTIKR